MTSHRAVTDMYRNGLPWRDAPQTSGPLKTLYNRWAWWSGKGGFARMRNELAAEAVHLRLDPASDAIGGASFPERPPDTTDWHPRCASCLCTIPGPET